MIVHQWFSRWPSCHGPVWLRSLNGKRQKRTDDERIPAHNWKMIWLILFSNKEVTSFFSVSNFSNMYSMCSFTTIFLHYFVQKKARKAMPFLWLFSFRAGNRVSIFACGNLRQPEHLLSYDEAVRAFDGAVMPTLSANFMQNFKSLGLLVLRIYPIK